MLEAAVFIAFASAVIILVVLAASAGHAGVAERPRPSDENWRHW